MVNAVIIQRVVPHYRVPLFAELHERLGWRVACAQTGPSHGLNTVDPGDHEWLTAFPFRRSRDSEYRAWVPLRAIIDDLRPDALVCEFSMQLSSTWRIALLGSRTPVAFWSQGWNRERGFDTFADRLVQKARLQLMRRADAQLVYSDESAGYLKQQLGSEAPIFVARNTLSIGATPERRLDTSPRDPAAPHIISVGRLTPDKNVPRVIEAFAKVRETLPAARMTVVGDGPDRALVEAAAARAQGSVDLRGAIYDEEEIGSLFRSASMLVVGGSVGLSVNHALAYGVPVMIFDDAQAYRHHPEHAYVIEGVTGFRVCEPGVDGLAAAMCRALEAPGPRAKLGSALAEYVDRELSLDSMIDGFRQLDAFFGNMR